MNLLIKKFDEYVIHHCQKLEMPMARGAIFIIYFWFGALKLLGLSPATPLVLALFEKTIGSLMSFDIFYSGFAIFEVIIGILFLIHGVERVAIYLLGLHLVTTILPLFLLPDLTWQSFLVPTLEGQYIIKNVLIVALAAGIASKLQSSHKNV